MPAMNQARELIGVPKLHGSHRPLARNEIHQGVDVTGEVAVFKSYDMPFNF